MIFMSGNLKFRKRTVQICYGGIIAALYVALTLVSAAVGLSSGVIQLRLSEALCILPVFIPAAIPGLTVGCLVANIVTGCVPMDVLFGTLATLLGALGTYALAHCPHMNRVGRWLSPVPTVVANTLIVPFVLKYAYNVGDAIWFIVLTVGAGEILSAGLLGTGLRIALERTFFKNKSRL